TTLLSNRHRQLVPVPLAERRRHAVARAVRKPRVVDAVHGGAVLRADRDPLRGGDDLSLLAFSTLRRVRHRSPLPRDLPSSKKRMNRPPPAAASSRHPQCDPAPLLAQRDTVLLNLLDA